MGKLRPQTRPRKGNYADLCQKYFEKKITNRGRSARAVVKRNKTGRNEPCPCASGKKFKRCCADEIDAKQ
jgi:uncharacterized protein YecA (UPF0149 family)